MLTGLEILNFKGTANLKFDLKIQGKNQNFG